MLGQMLQMLCVAAGVTLLILGGLIARDARRRRRELARQAALDRATRPRPTQTAIFSTTTGKEDA